MGTYAPVQDHRDACGCPMHLGRVEGRRGSSGLLWSRGQRWRSGLVRVMRCSENGDSLKDLGCALLRPALTVFLGKPGGSLDAHAASAVDSGKPEKKGARPATPHLAALNGLARFCWLLTVCSCVVVALFSARSPRLLWTGLPSVRAAAPCPRYSIRTSGFFILILNSLILYLRVKGVKHIHTHTF